MADELFSDGQLRELLDRQLDRVESVVGELSAKSLDRPKNAVKKAVGELEVDVPELKRTRASVDVDEGDPMVARLRVPFKGESSMFSLRPRDYSTKPPEATVDESGGVLVFSRDFAVGTSADEVTGWASRAADSVEQYLYWQSADVGRYRHELVQRVEALVEERRARVAAIGEVQSDLDDVSDV
jgi:hypothetical protein